MKLKILKFSEFKEVMLIIIVWKSIREVRGGSSKIYFVRSIAIINILLHCLYTNVMMTMIIMMISMIVIAYETVHMELCLI